MDTEIIATSTVKLEISKTERLSPYVNEKDKEPCWDGNIYIHANKQHSKDNIKRVPVQIKGEAVSRRKVKEHIQYEISTSDLTAYKLDGGVIFFVVYIDNKTGEKLQIYYSELLPERIKVLLSNGAKKVRFKKFPTAVMKMEDLFLDFYENSRKQVSFSIVKTESPAVFAKKRDFKGFSFSITSSHKLPSLYELPKYLEGESLSIYGLLTSTDVPIPVEYIDEITNIVVAEDVDIPIFVDSKKFYDACKRMFFKDKIVLRVGSCVKIIFKKDEQGKIVAPLEVDYKSEGTLSERILGLKFFIAAIEDKGFYFGKMRFDFNIEDNGFKSFKLSNLNYNLRGYERAKKTLDLISVKKDLDLDKCSESDYEALNALVKSIYNRQPINGIPPVCNQITSLKIGNLNLAVLYVPYDENSYIIAGVFNTNFKALFTNNVTKEEVIVSQFTFMTADDFLKYDNTNLDFIIEDYKAVQKCSDVSRDATVTALEFIKAYDKSKKETFLDAATRVFAWLSSISALPKDILLIDQLQIILRQRPLNYEEKCLLNDLIKATTDSQIKCCAFLLLDEQEEAKKLLDNFDTALLDRFKSYPIYKFYKAS